MNDSKDEFIKFQKKLLMKLKKLKFVPGNYFSNNKIFIFIAKPNSTLIKNTKNQLRSGSFIFFLYPPCESLSKEDLYSDINPDDPIIFTSLTDSLLSHKIAYLVNYLDTDNVTLHIQEDLQKIKYKKEIEQIIETISDIIDAQYNRKFSELIRLRCFVHNLPQIKSHEGVLITQPEEPIAALICAAGPSLSEHLEIIERNRNKFILISVGHAAKTLIEANIIPDFIVEIDPVSNINWQIANKRILKDTILVSSYYLSPAITQLFKKIIWADSHLAYSQVLELNKLSKLNLYLDKSASITALDFAIKIGCEKIAITGQDLSFSSKDMFYSDGSGEELFNGMSFIEVEGDFGKVITNKNFHVIQKALEDFIKKMNSNNSFSKKKPEIFNCTKVGAKIRNTKIQSLEEFCFSITNTPKKTDLISFTDHCENRNKPGIIKKELAKYIAKITEIIKVSSELLTARTGKSNIQTSIDKLQINLNQLFKEEVKLQKNKLLFFWIYPIIRYCDKTTGEYSESRNLKITAANQIFLINWRFKLIYNLCKELLKDFNYSNLRHDVFLKKKTKELIYPSPYKFKSFRNYALRFIKKNNNELANALAIKSFKLQDKKFLIIPDQEYCYVRVKDKNPPPTPLSSHFNFMKKNSKKVITSFIDSTNYKPLSDAVIFYPPGNWLYPIEFTRLFPRAKLMVIELWPELLSNIISHSMLFHYLPDHTQIIAISEKLKNWESISKKKIKDWADENKRILLFKAPEAWNLVEVKNVYKNKIYPLIKNYIDNG